MIGNQQRTDEGNSLQERQRRSINEQRLSTSASSGVRENRGELMSDESEQAEVRTESITTTKKGRSKKPVRTEEDDYECERLEPPAPDRVAPPDVQEVESLELGMYTNGSLLVIRCTDPSRVVDASEIQVQREGFGLPASEPFIECTSTTKHACNLA